MTVCHDCKWYQWLAAIWLLTVVSPVGAAEPDPDEAAIRAAIVKSLKLLEQCAETSTTIRPDCFTCHSQGLPIMVIATARRRGFAVDEDELQAQLRFTADFLAKNREQYRSGRGQAGQTFMAGYALWALEHGDWPADDTTAAVAEYYLRFQADSDHWECHTDRPPSESSDFTANFLGLQALNSFGLAEQRDRIVTRREQIRGWLLRTKPSETEDRVFRAWALHIAAAAAADVNSAAEDLLATQNSDGGWSQKSDRASDAYATGTALAALHRIGRLTANTPQYRNGIRYLLKAQHADGSWQVNTRSEPFQTYYESGYPHGEDQFISATAAGWATLSLLFTLPETPPESGPLP